jgi:hypothetical protein
MHGPGVGLVRHLQERARDLCSSDSEGSSSRSLSPL